MLETLYKKDYKGNILKWEVQKINNIFGISIKISYGKYDGQLIVQTRNNIQGKNIGKSNETSPSEQADLEIKSLIANKKKEGYKSLEDLISNTNISIFDINNLYKFLLENLPIDSTDANNNVKPMKAQQYYRSKKDWKGPDGLIYKDRKYFYITNPYASKENNAIIIKFPCLIQPKINGIRCTISLNNNNEVQILSKEGIKYSLPIIEQEFKNNISCFNYNNTKIIFDGELYIHGQKLQTIASAVKSNNLYTPSVKFICFDLAIPNMANIDRIKLMKELLQFKTFVIESSIDYVSTFRVKNDFETQKYTDKFIEEGYEGSILRDDNATYQFGKRPMTMVKLKRTEDAEFTIVDIRPQSLNPHLGLYVCRTPEGKEFEVTPHGTEDFKRLLLFRKNQYIGKQLTCVFYEYTEDNIPFHIISNIIRDYE